MNYIDYISSRKREITPERGLRPSWDLYFLSVSSTLALRGDCRRRQIGACVVDSRNRIISTGYNGSPPGGPSCLDGRCPRGKSSYEEIPKNSNYSNCIATHAEENAIADIPCTPSTISYLHLPLTLYVSDSPFPECWEKIIYSGFIDRIVWRERDKEYDSEKYFEVCLGQKGSVQPVEVKNRILSSLGDALTTNPFGKTLGFAALST